MPGGGYASLLAQARQATSQASETAEATSSFVSEAKQKQVQMTANLRVAQEALEEAQPVREPEPVLPSQPQPWTRPSSGQETAAKQSESGISSWGCYGDYDRMLLEAYLETKRLLICRSE